MNNTQGYIIPAIRNGLVDYVRQAVVLAMSIKKYSSRPVAVLVRNVDDVSEENIDVFDYVIELPYGVSSETDLEQDCAIWQVYDASPFDTTMVINSCALLLNNDDQFWEAANGKHVVFPYNTTNFRGMPGVYRFKYKTQKKNSLLKVPSSCFMFNKTKQAKEFFDWCGPVFSNWRASQKKLLVDKTSERFSSSLMFSLAATLFDDLDPIDKTGSLTYTDLTVDNIHTIFDKDVEKTWCELSIPSWLTTNCELKVGNYLQSGLVVYNENEFLTHEFEETIRSSFFEAQEINSSTSEV